MVNQSIELVAALAGRGAISLDDVRAELPEGADAKRRLFRLSELGLVFRIAHGRYAVPGKETLSEALAVSGPPVRLAAWLHRWFREEGSQVELASGLDWRHARFAGLALHVHSELRWEGPELMVPIEEDAERIDRLHHSVSVFAYDPAEEPREVEIGGRPALLPHPNDLARVLLVHPDPRLQEAGQRLREDEREQDEREQDQRGGADSFDVLLDRTDPPMPFPDARLPRGPPFRYRVLAPRSWVYENLEHAHPSRPRTEEVT